MRGTSVLKIECNTWGNGAGDSSLGDILPRRERKFQLLRRRRRRRERKGGRKWRGEEGVPSPSCSKCGPSREIGGPSKARHLHSGLPTDYGLDSTYFIPFTERKKRIGIRKRISKDEGQGRARSGRNPLYKEIGSTDYGRLFPRSALKLVYLSKPISLCLFGFLLQVYTATSAAC